MFTTVATHLFFSRHRDVTLECYSRIAGVEMIMPINFSNGPDPVFAGMVTRG